MTYAPNLKNRGVLKRVAQVVGWAVLTLHPVRSKDVHHEVLERVFGGRTANLSVWLRERLLVKVDGYEVGVKSCGYVLNAEGLAMLKQALSAERFPVEVTTINTNRIHDFVDEIESGNFEYAPPKKSKRLTHPLQNIRREAKAAFWSKHGYHWNYDIEAAGPTLMFQLALKAGMPRIALGAIDAYLQDRRGFRQHVAAVAGCDYDTAKEVINGLFLGARLGANWKVKIFRLLKGDHGAVFRLQDDLRLGHFRANVKRMWARIGESRGENLTSAKAAGARSIVYYKYERLVLDAMRDELRDQNARHFCEHDGFISDVEVDVALVQKRVAQVTGFAIKLSVTSSHEQNSSKQEEGDGLGVGCQMVVTSTREGHAQGQSTVQGSGP